MEISITAEVVSRIFSFPITNSLIMAILVSLVTLLICYFLLKSLQSVPGKSQSAVEMFLEAVLKTMTETLESRELAKKFFPFIASIFLFILLNNWLGIVPGVGSLGFRETHGGEELLVPFFRSANSDLNTTLALALISVFTIQWYGIKMRGFSKHFSTYFSVSRGPVHFFVGILEFIGEFAKIMSFSFRLFGNVFAGEVLLLIVMTLVPLIAPSPFLLLELFVGFIQALVFAMLSLMFLKVATATAH